MPRRTAAAPYTPPEPIGVTTLDELLVGTGRTAPPAPKATSARQDLLFAGAAPSPDRALTIYYAGDRSLLHRRCVAIVGTRKVTPEGAARARRMARELVAAGVVVVSGLAEGVDTVALNAAIEAGGKTIGVLGTPLDRATPQANGPLQELMCREHLVLSQFAIGTPVHKGYFPQRNRTMAAVTDGTVIIEASDTSGTLHQAAECTRLRRWLFILRSLVDTPDVNWPANFLKYDTTVVIGTADDVISRVTRRASR